MTKVWHFCNVVMIFSWHFRYRHFMTKVWRFRDIFVTYIPWQKCDFFVTFSWQFRSDITFFATKNTATFSIYKRKIFSMMWRVGSVVIINLRKSVVLIEPQNHLCGKKSNSSNNFQVINTSSPIRALTCVKAMLT